MFSTEEELTAVSRARLKVQDLARGCGWLDAVLRQQDRVLHALDAFEDRRDAVAWTRMRQAVQALFRVEEVVLAPAILAQGLRAHVVVAEMSRHRILRDIDDLRSSSRGDAGPHMHGLRTLLVSHFTQEEGDSYRALARQLDERRNAALTARCLGELAGIGEALDESAAGDGRLAVATPDA